MKSVYFAYTFSIVLLCASCKSSFRGMFYKLQDDVYAGIVDANLLDPTVNFPQPYDSNKLKKVGTGTFAPQSQFYINLVNKATIEKINHVKIGKDGKEKKKKKKSFFKFGKKKGKGKASEKKTDTQTDSPKSKKKN